MPELPTRRSLRIRFVPVAAVVFCVVAAGGAAAWFLLGADQKTGTCEALLKDEHVRSALGSSYKADMSCSELGEAVKKAAVGVQPGQHSLQQAQVMKTVVMAVDENLEKTSGHIDAALRVPFAESLADYAADTASTIGLGDRDYVRNGSPSKPAWKDDEGVHMAVPRYTLLRVARALSEDSTAYVTLRGATTHHAAEVLTAVPRRATGVDLTVPPMLNSHVFGAFDAFATAVRRDLGKERAAEWDRKVFEEATARQSVPPPYAKDPVGHLVASWQQTLREGGLENSADVLEQQNAVMVDVWSKATGLSDKVRDSLHDDALNDTSAARGNALRNLS
ncbi:hypothetical protein [Streptomyces nodosus]|uniref:hypothetical protein n=1 Tax=Streptomyces nodosus TaxID=40318 RepID=UPI0036E423CD